MPSALKPASARKARPPRRGRSTPWLAWFAILRSSATRRAGIRIGLGLLVVLAGLLVLRVSRSGALPGTELYGVDVGGMSEPDLRKRVEELQRQIDGMTLGLARQGGPPRNAIYRSDASRYGYVIDVEATVERVLERGRQVNPVAAFVDHLRAFFVALPVEPVEAIDQQRLAAEVAAATEALTVPPREGDLRFTDLKVTPVYPEPGWGVDPGRVEGSVLQAIRTLSENDIELASVQVDPITDPADVDALASQGRLAISAPVVLRRGEVKVAVSPSELAGLLEVRLDPDAAGDTAPLLTLAVRPKELRQALGDRVAQLEAEPVDATFTVSDGGVEVVPARPGLVLDGRAAAAQIVELATSEGGRSARLQMRKTQPDFSTKEARALGVTEQVSSFTTYHSCCEPRVENIHTAAAEIDGTIIEPGETFSLNEALGPRTEESGYVAAPAIRDGEFVAEVGGGISQLATTFFNAVFFGGYDFLEYKAHSYYISRYPPGREATISTPVPDLAFLNDSDHGIFIDTSYSDTSITVTFYGTQEVEVESVTGERTNINEPEEECRVNRDLAKGEEVVVQDGITGFDIVVTRIFTHPDDSETEERFFTHYLMQPRIVERRSCDDGKGSDEDNRGARSEPA